MTEVLAYALTAFCGATAALFAFSLALLLWDMTTTARRLVRG